MPDLLHVHGGGIGEEALFAGSDRLFGLAECVGAAGFYFYKYKSINIFGDEVNFGTAPAPIGFENAIAFLFEEAAGQAFAGFADVEVFCQAEDVYADGRSALLKKNSLHPKPGRERLSQKPILILSRIVCRFLTQKDYDLLVVNYNHCGLYIKFNKGIFQTYSYRICSMGMRTSVLWRF